VSAVIKWFSFFFSSRRRHTRWPRDWSSDVCSSDLVVSAALAAIGKLGFCRLAQPGEFTRRAFEHGKLDLTRAEAVADLVAAETEIGRASCRERVEIPGGAAARKKKNVSRSQCRDTS